ncbi:hypothetical protein ACFVWN_00215 [Nocardiopsis flavescens]|uniref:hypothetical protein n=1 Tax=Nocardiopsis flavescens TaxID=758803 RepID=UPI00364FA42E
MRKAAGQGRTPPGDASPWRRLGMLAASGLLAYFFLAVGVQLAGHELRALGAAYGWSGEAGRVTVTHEEVRHSRSTTRICFGTFESDGGAVREGVQVQSSRGCEPGRVADVRWVPGEDTWLTTTTADRVYEDAGFGSGAGTSLLLLVFMGLFCFGLGGLFAVGAVAVGGGLAWEVLLRAVRRQSK